MSEEITKNTNGFEVVKKLMYSAIDKMILLTNRDNTKPLDKKILENFFSANPNDDRFFDGTQNMFEYCSSQDINHEEVIKLVEEFINNMEKSDFLERRNSVENRTITFAQQRSEAKKTYWYRKSVV